MPTPPLLDRNALADALRPAIARPVHLLALAGLLLLAGCADEQPTAPEAGGLSVAAPSLATTSSGTLTQITTDASRQENAAISGDRIVWQDDRNGNGDIYLHDLTTATQTRLTTNAAYQVFPAVSGHYVVAQDYRNGNADIYLYDLSTSTKTQVTTSSAHQYFPAISGDRIVWQDARNGNWDIYLYDLSTGTETQITTSSADQTEPDIAGDRIVWQDARNGNADIYLYDLATGTETQITSSLAEQTYPAISGYRIAWEDHRNGNQDIYLYDLSTSAESQITTSPANQGRPAISGGQVAWQDSRNGNWDIYSYDLVAGTLTQVTTSSASQTRPSTSGERVVWQDYRNGNNDIFLYPPPSPPDYYLYGQQGSQLVRIDPSTGATASVGPSNFEKDITEAGLATSRGEVTGPGGVVFPAGTHFGVYEGYASWPNPEPNYVVTLDVETGQVTKLIELDVLWSDGHAPRGAAFGPDGTTLYVAVNGKLWTVDIQNGTAQEIGSTVGTSSLEWDPESNAFLAISNGDLYQIDPATGTATNRGDVYIGARSLVRGPDGSWFAPYYITSLTGEDALYQIDVQAGSSTLIGGSGLRYVMGMVVERTAAEDGANQPPVADAGGAYTGTEGSAVTLELTGSDPDGDALTYTWDLGDGTTGSGTTPPTSHTYPDDGSYTITLTVTDADGASDTQTSTATIDNVAPTITSVSGPADPQELGTQISIETAFTDPGAEDTHDASIDWGDGTSSALTGVTSPFEAAYTYAAPGVYTVTVTVSDDDGGSDSESYEYVVIYDPDAGFVTGGGWIDSPAGAYTAAPGLEGKATFGFVSKYKKGAEVPSGNTEFVFKAAYFGFHSNAYDWLIVNQNGTNAQFRGSGLVNGGPAPNGTEYQFMLWAGDDTSDTFRIRIWWEDSAGAENVVYDNGYDQLLGGGSIVIHAK